MGQDDLRKAVIYYEYRNFVLKTHLEELFPEAEIKLTSTGQYDEILYHIYVHKYFINQNYEEELPFVDAVKSWYLTVYTPICEIVRDNSMIDRFPGRTESDLYVWIVKHWHYLKEKYGENITAEDAAESYSRIFGTTPLKRFSQTVRAFFSKFAPKK